MQTREGGAFEDTMLLLEIIKEKKIEETKKLKVLTSCQLYLSEDSSFQEEKIRQMALEQKKKKNMKEGSSTWF